MNEPRLSPYGSTSARPSPVNRMMAAFARGFRDGIDCNLGVGYVNEQTIPRDQIYASFRAVLQNPRKYRQALNYGGPHGSPNLIAALTRFLAHPANGAITPELLRKNRLIIGANGASTILEGIAQILPHGIVLTSDPQYYIYCDFLRRMGFRVISVPQDEYGVRPGLLQKKIEGLGQEAEKIAFLYFVTVNNPTCSILSDSRRRRIVSIARRISRKKGSKIFVFFDKAYEQLIHGPGLSAPPSSLHYDYDGLVYELGTVSKVLAPALRVGYMIGPDTPFLQAQIQKVSDGGFSAPLITQEMVSYLLDTSIETQVRTVQKGYRRKARKTGEWLRHYLGPFIQHIHGGSAGFYYYITFKSILTTEHSLFYRYLSRTTGDPGIDGPADSPNPRVVYLPGQFCVDPHGDLQSPGRRQIRISYAFESLPRIRTALGIFAQAARYATLEQKREQ